MRTRAVFVLGLTLLGISGGLAALERQAARNVNGRDSDLAQLAALLEGHAALRASVLEARAGLDWSGDAINHAVIVLRGAATRAASIAARGPSYNAAAEALSHAASALDAEEGMVETFKTDLALMRLSARNFPLAADALTGDTLYASVRELRSQIERYQDAPTHDAARRIETLIEKLAATRGSAGADVDVLLGHVRVILERRERLDEVTRALVRSPVRAQLEAARVSYERAAWPLSARLLGLRIAVIQIALAGVLALAAATWRGLRRAPSAS